MSPDASFYEALEEASLAENHMEIVEVQGRRIFLVKSNGKIHALDNACPHLGGSLGRGTIKNGSVICPLHHWTFDLSTGRAIMGVADEKVPVFETKVENGKVFVQLPA